MGKIMACKEEDMADGKVHKASIAGKDVAVVNLGGQYCAFDDTCTHAGASLAEGKVDGCRIVCGWHGAEFDCKTGRLEKFPAKIRDLQSYNVVVESGGVFIEV